MNEPHQKTPLVVCLLDGGWTQCVGVAIRVVARSKRKLKIDSSPVVAFAESTMGGTFELWTANGNVYSFALDGRHKGTIPNSVPAASAAAED